MASPRALCAVLTPHGGLKLEACDGETTLAADAAERLARAFARGSGHGLLQLGLAEAGTVLPTDLAYWRGLALRFVAAAAQAGGEAGPAPGDLEAFLDAAPPMPGGEYLDAERLSAFWAAMAAAMAVERAESGLSLDEWLAARDSRWRLVGRVHLNLAENRKDPELPFAFLATYAAGLGAEGQLRHAPLGAALREYAGAGARAELLKLLAPLSRAGEACGWLKQLVDSGEIFQPLRWTPAEALQLLRDLETLEQAGLAVRMPASWPQRRPARPQVAATVGAKPPSRVGAGALLDFQVEATLDGEPLTPEEIRALAASTEGLALLRGRWVEVDAARLKATLDRYAEIEAMAARDGVSFAEAMRLIAGADIASEAGAAEATQSWGEVKAGPWLAEALAACRRPETLDAATPGAALQATLRPYQVVGVRWLMFLARLGLGACLADDMGLGKTLQVIALVAALREAAPKGGPSLIVAPASLLANWAAEAERFAPSLRVFVAHPAFAKPETMQNLAAALAGADLVVTSYGALTRLAALRETRWRLAVADEAQAIKNPGAQQTRAVKQLKAEARIALTGTPVENHLGDLWSIFDFINPGLLGGSKAFSGFVKSLSARTPPSYAPLRKLVAPYILRRMKTDRTVISDLPDKTEVKAWCALSRKQAAIYQSTVQAFEEKLREVDKDVNRRGLVLSTLMRLKQICNHAAHGLDLAGGLPQADSGKLARLSEIAATIASRQEKLLVFTQFAEIIPGLAAHLATQFGRPGLHLSGETAVAKRRALVKRFQEDESLGFFVLSLKAGGAGLTLTAANHVVHFDRWWNPAVENQATDRAFRIGQKRNVLVHKFICRGTVEERIDGLIESKRQLAEDMLAGGGEINLTEMSDRDLLAMVRLDIDAATREAA